jgi:type I restriction enzyme S subunit
MSSVPPGYKQTEVGVIPEEWDSCLLTDICWFQEGPGLRNWQFKSSGMKVINVTNLEFGVLNLDRTDRHISLDEFKRMYQHFAIDSSDIVMASSGNSYSKTAIVREQDLPLVMNTSVIRFKPIKDNDYSFLWSFLTSWIFKDQIDLMITGGAQPNFGPFHLKKVLVPRPPLPEQRAIATALSDVDTLIASLDKLIAKKRDMKQAAMQELLTGKRRLPGFSGEWEVKRLGEILKVRHGKSQQDVVVSDGMYPILATGGEIGRTNTSLYDKPSVLIGRKGTIDVPQYIDTPFWTIDTLFFTEISSLASPKFIFYKFNSINWYNYNEASGVPSLNASTIENIEFNCPPPPRTNRHRRHPL